MAEATDAQIRDSARIALARLEPLSRSLASELTVMRWGASTAQNAPALHQVWPTLYHIVTLQQSDPIAIWNLPKQDVIALLPPDTPIGGAIRAFHAAVNDYYPAEASVEGMLHVITCGVDFLNAAQVWWTDNQRS